MDSIFGERSESRGSMPFSLHMERGKNLLNTDLCFEVFCALLTSSGAHETREKNASVGRLIMRCTWNTAENIPFAQTSNHLTKSKQSHPTEDRRLPTSPSAEALRELTAFSDEITTRLLEPSVGLALSIKKSGFLTYKTRV